VREGLIDFMQREYPQFLPKMRIESDGPQEREQQLRQQPQPQPQPPSSLQQAVA
jgi:hypothetical protein